MSAKASDKLEIHPGILKRLERIKTARKDDVLELKGGAIAFAEAQVDAGTASIDYMEEVKDRAYALAYERIEYLDRVPTALISFFTLIASAPNLILALLRLIFDEGYDWGFGAYFSLGSVAVGLVGVFWSIGFRNCWFEVKKRKWRWIVGFAVYIVISGWLASILVNDHGEWESCSQDPNCTMLQGEIY